MNSPRLLLLASLFSTLAAPLPAQELSFEVSFSAEARAEPITGRVYTILTLNDRRPPVNQVSETGAPFFGLDVFELAPGARAVIDGEVFGYPLASIDDLPKGEYTVQGFVNVYTEFPRADGHTIWLHDDQWEGQSWRRSPGNLYSLPQRVSIDPEQGGAVELVCDQVIPPRELPADTEYVKRFRFQSEILSAFWGKPIYLGATVLLPEGYEEHPEVHYPVNYIQGHFSTRAPGGFGRGRLTEWWKADGTPRFLLVTFQHPSPYYDDSYGVNSANNGPYGDALLQELIPEVERRFRAIREPWARKLSGGSTGGWISLALQIFYPDFFGGVWSACPDSVDFRYYQIVDIYDDENAYWIDHGFMKVERPGKRSIDGNIRYMMKDENWKELVVGTRGRSGGQWDIWEATYGPVGEDGYPRRIWDKRTGEIDREVAEYWREHYDLRHILERDWETLGPRLRGKLHVYVGDMDNYHLNMGVRLLAEFLERADPPYEGSIEFEPMYGHCYGPGIQEALRLMTEHIDRYAPAGADLSSWRY